MCTPPRTRSTGGSPGTPRHARPLHRHSGYRRRSEPSHIDARSHPFGWSGVRGVRCSAMHGSVGGGLVDSGNGGLLGDLVVAARDQAFVGRVAERAVFRSALAGDSHAPSVLYLHGPGGIGKSALLRRFALEAQEAGRPVIEVDGRAVGATPEDFEHAAGKAIGEPNTVLLVDTFELCHGVDACLCEQFLAPFTIGGVLLVAGH